MVDLEKIVRKHQDGAIFNLSVKPNSESIVFPAGLNKWRNSIEMKVSSPAKDNKANKDVLVTIANFFDKPVNNVYMISGTKKKNKTILIKGATTKYITGRLRDYVDGL